MGPVSSAGDPRCHRAHRLELRVGAHDVPARSLRSLRRVFEARFQIPILGLSFSGKPPPVRGPGVPVGPPDSDSARAEGVGRGRARVGRVAGDGRVVGVQTGGWG